MSTSQEFLSAVTGPRTVVPAGEVLCVGELLWDALPAGLFLGGAPFNVACHLSSAGVPVAMVSRVGADRLGEEGVRRAQRYGVRTDLVQIDPALPTGVVSAAIDQSGQPTYVIVDSVAWDAIEPTEVLLARAEKSRAIVFGSLAQRHATTRRTIERLCETNALLVFDVNLRPPFEDRDVIRRSLERADVVKVNLDELQRLASWFELPRGDRESASALSRAFSCPVVCVTRGAGGAALWRDDTWTEHPGFDVEVRDTVGAGDAFLAVLLAGLLSGVDSEKLLKNANRIGADVASQVGALPVY
ncbi:MAG: carbohydrate kinase [Gemmatimonadota bacterium]|nr:carbohydrate kinase [Gemmatimonadota bacterium]